MSLISRATFDSDCYERTTKCVVRLEELSGSLDYRNWAYRVTRLDTGEVLYPSCSINDARLETNMRVLPTIYLTPSSGLTAEQLSHVEEYSLLIYNPVGNTLTSVSRAEFASTISVSTFTPSIPHVTITITEPWWLDPEQRGLRYIQGVNHFVTELSASPYSGPDNPLEYDSPLPDEEHDYPPMYEYGDAATLAVASLIDDVWHVTNPNGGIYVNT